MECVSTCCGIPFSISLRRFVDSHPIHPSTVHWPIGLITASFGLDALDLLRNKNYVSPGLDKFLPPVSAARLTSHYMGALGVIMAVPSILTGLAELC